MLFYIAFSCSDYKSIYRQKVPDNQEIKLTKGKSNLNRKSIMPT